MSVTNVCLQWLKKPWVVFHVLLIIQLIIFLILLFRPFSFIPPGRVYPIIDKNFFYPNLILQAKEGAWNLRDTHTTFPSPRLYIYLFFVLLGKIALVANAQPVWVYLWARVICGILTFYATYWFIRSVFPKSLHLLSLLFALGLESGPLLSGLPVLRPLFENRMLILRNFGLPHHEIAKALGLIFIGTLLSSLKNPTPKKAILLMLTGLGSTIAMPAYTFTFALCAFVPIGIWALWTKNIVKILPTMILSSIVLVAPNILFAIEFTKGIPWTNSTPNEKTWFSTEYIRTEYLSSLMLYIPLFLIVLVLLKRMWPMWDAKLKFIVSILICWVVGPMIWVTFAKQAWFPMPNHRLTDSYGYVPVGMLAAVGVQSIISFFHNKKIRTSVYAFVLLFFFVPSLFLTINYTQQLFAAEQTTDIHIYIPEKTWQGMMFLKTVPKESGILVREPFGEILPAFANIRVYVGGIHNFPDWLAWQWTASRFFQGGIPIDETKDFLLKSDISYVFDGPDEQSLGSIKTQYTEFLQPVFSNEEVTIFKVLRDKLQ